MKIKNKEHYGITLLFLTSLIWGSSFVVIKYAVSRIDTFWFLSIRCLLATIFTLIVFNKRIKEINKKAVCQGIILGTLMTGAIAFQVLGCSRTTVGKNAFLTSTYVAIIPFVTWIRNKKRPSSKSFLAAGICLCGAAVLSLGGVAKLNLGDFFSVAAAFFWALDFEFTAEFSKQTDAVSLQIVQISTSTIISTVIALMISPTSNQTFSLGVVGCILYTGILANAIAFLMQIVGQKYVDSVTSGVIFAFEAVFAGAFSIIILHERITIKFAVGAALIFSSVLIPRINLEKIFAHSKKHSANR